MHGSKYLPKKKESKNTSYACISEEIKLPKRPGKLAASLVMYISLGEISPQTEQTASM